MEGDRWISGGMDGLIDWRGRDGLMEEGGRVYKLNDGWMYKLLACLFYLLTDH